MSESLDNSRQWATQIDRQARGWLSILFGAFRDVLSFRYSLFAAATAYFALFSLFPLILLTVAVTSQQFSEVLAGSDVIIERLEVLMPALSELLGANLEEGEVLAGSDVIIERFEFLVPALGELLGANLEQIVEARGTVTGLSIVALIWSASSVFYILTRGMDAVWEDEDVRPAWRHRALAVLATMALSIVLLAASLFWSIIVPIFNTVAPEPLIRVSPYLGPLGAGLLNILVFSLLYLVLPHARLTWRDVLTGAIIAGLLWEVAKRGFLFFATNYLTLSNLVYGSVTAIIAFLTWVYLSMLIFLFGALVNVRYRNRQQSQSLLESEK
jgi:membrane protein